MRTRSVTMDCVPYLRRAALVPWWLLLASAGCGADEVAPSADPADPAAQQPLSREAWQKVVAARVALGQRRFEADRGAFVGVQPATATRARLTGSGARIEPLVGEAFSLELSLRAVEVDGAPLDLGAAAPEAGPCADPAVDATGACLPTVRFARGAVAETWENAADGLRVRWEVARTSGDRLVLAWDAAGAEPVIEAGSQGVRLAGTPLRWREVRAWDAAGAALVGWFEVVDGGIRVVVDTTDAVGAVTIDPVLASADVRLWGQQEYEEFGDSVADAGDVNGDGLRDLVVGAPAYSTDASYNYRGRILVFHGRAGGFSALPDATVDGTQDASRFGERAVGVGDINDDGFDDVVVSAPDHDNGQTNEGKAWLHYGSATGLSATSAWTAEANQANAYFGRQIVGLGDVNGDRFGDFAIAAPLFDGSQTDGGRVFVWYGAAGAPAANANATKELNQASVHFGTAMAAGDVNADGRGDLVVGAPDYQNGNYGEGRAVLFLGSGGAGGLGAAAWTGEPNSPYAAFGTALALGDVNADGRDDLVVGAPTWAATIYGASEGRVWVYNGTAAGLAAAGTTLDGNGEDYASFGAAVAVADLDRDGYGDVAIGAPDSNLGGGDSGAVQIHRGGASGASATPSWFVSDDGRQSSGGFAESFATVDHDGDGYDDLAIEGPYNGGEYYEGEVDFVVSGQGAPVLDDGRPTTATIEAPVSGAYWGVAVAFGDLNDDGRDDAVIGAPQFSGLNFSGEGRVYAFLGTAAGLSTTAGWTGSGGSNYAELGSSVAVAPDVNGDGYDDLVVGAPEKRVSYGNYPGGIVVYYGGPAGPAGAPWTYNGTQSTMGLGESVVGLGDVNGDGYGDIAAGAPRWDNGQTDEGRVYAFLGGAAGLAAAPAWTKEGGQNYAAMGDPGTLAAGRVNGDAYADLITVVRGWDGARSDGGKASAWHGSATGLGATEAWTALGERNGVGASASVAVGDFDGDAYDDVVVGEPAFYDAVLASRGRAKLYRGGASGLRTLPSWQTFGSTYGERLGTALAAGDVDGDGHDELAVGSPQWSDSHHEEGRVQVWSGSATGLGAMASWQVEGDRNSVNAGIAFAFGDAEGDGYDDLLIGNDGSGSSDTDGDNLYEVLVVRGNRPPVFGAVANRTDAEDDLVDLPISAPDPDGDAPTFTATGLPPGTTIDVATGRITGALTFEASAGSPYAVVVSAHDPRGGGATLGFTWTVTDTNRLPVATDVSWAADEDEDLVVDAANGVLADATDPDGDALTASLAVDGAIGSAQVFPDGSFVYTPDQDAVGADAFDVDVTDGDDTVTITVDVLIGAVNDAPVVTVPAPMAVQDHVPNTLAAIVVSDQDAGAAAVEVTLFGYAGTVTLATTTGLTFQVGDGTADPSSRFTGTLTRVNAALAALRYTPDGSGPDELWIAVDDLGNTGAGGSGLTEEVYDLTVAPTVLGLTASSPLVAGTPGTLTATGAQPLEYVTFVRGATVGAGSCDPALGGQCFGITAAQPLATVRANASGVAVLTAPIPANLAGATLAAQAYVARGPSGIYTVLSAPVVLPIQ